MKTNLLFFWVGLALLFAGCEREPVIPPSNLKDLVVPADFSWTNGQVNKLTVNLVNPKNLPVENRIMQLMDGSGRLIEQSVVRSGIVRFNTEIPTVEEQLVLYFPMTRNRLELDNTGGARNIAFNVAPPLEEPRILKSGGTSPNCTDGCTQVFSGNLTSLEIKAEGTYCLTGTLNGGLTITKNATLRICGTANVTWTSIGNKQTVKIIVSSTGTLTSGSFYLDGANHSLENYGTIRLDNWFNVKTSLLNYGQMQVKGLEVLTGATLENHNTFTSNGEVNISGTITNKASFTISAGQNSLNINRSGTLNNDCRFIVPNNINSQGKINLSGYLRTANFFYGESTGSVTFANQGMLHCANFQPDCPITCTDPNGFGSVKVDAVTNIDTDAAFTGAIDICDANGIENNWGAKLGTNVTYCEKYIAVSGCNPEGVGTPPVTDRDQDGIVDDEDQYPTDPQRAFQRAEPYEGYKTWAFEDLWPSTGDYDFNDLVIATRIVYSLGADMKPVDAECEMIVKALGAGVSNGVGLQFLGEYVPAENFISGITGEKSVLDPATGKTIIVSPDVRKDLKPFYNNNGQGPKGTPQSFRFKVTFNLSVVMPVTVLTGDFFLFRTDDRTREIHVPDAPATLAASAEFFGTGDDATMPGENYWYKTRNGITWGMTLITLGEEWTNPIEKTPILQAFPEFRDWAVSGGKQNREWHKKGVYEKCFHF